MVLRQTVRLAAIGVTCLSTNYADQQDFVKLLDLLLDQVIEMRVEKEANMPVNQMRKGVTILMDEPEGEML